MKKFSLILIIMMFALMCACGSSSDSDNSAVSTPAASQSSSETEVSEPAVEPSEEPVEEPEVTPDMGENAGETQPDEQSLKDIAMGFVGAEVSELIAAIGEPESSDYAPSCLGDGEDGNLYYDGFVVYTYRENGVETVEYVE